jgi:hypothetical protein
VVYVTRRRKEEQKTSIERTNVNYLPNYNQERKETSMQVNQAVMTNFYTWQFYSVKMLAIGRLEVLVNV